MSSDPNAHPSAPTGFGGQPSARVGYEAVSKGKRRVRGFTVFLLLMLGVALVLGLNFKTVEVKGNSMYPTLKDGRRVLTSHALWLVGSVKKGDIIVLAEKPPIQGYFIKRVYGLPGDEIDWAYAPRDHPMSQGKFKVPPDTFYVLGDNLPQSSDSRVFGPVEQSRLLGKVVVAK